MISPEWLPTPINQLISNSDIFFLTEYYYKIFKQDLFDAQLIFESKNIVINSPLFYCDKKFVKTGKNCNNTLFNCCNCIFKNKEELFCHIISKRDDKIIPLLKSRYRNYQKSRVPGIFVISRLEKVRWIPAIINEYKKNYPKEILYFDDIETKGSRERIIYFWLKNQNFVIVLGENFWDSKQKDILYLKTAYVVDEDTTKYMLSRKYKKYKKRQEKILASRNPLCT